MFNNGLRRATLGITSITFRRTMARHEARLAEREATGKGWGDRAHPAQLGYGMILEARGNVYGDNASVPGSTKAANRARNKRARRARAMHRRAAR